MQAISSLQYTNAAQFLKPQQAAPTNLSFSEILSQVKGATAAKLNLSQVTAPPEVTKLFELQKRVFETHLKVELVSKVADGSVATVRRLQQGQ